MQQTQIVPQPCLRLDVTWPGSSHTHIWLAGELSQDFPKQNPDGASADLTEESAYPLIFPSQTQPA